MPSGSYPSRRRRKRHHSNRKRLNRINERLHSIATKESRDFTPFRSLTEYNRWKASVKVVATKPAAEQAEPKRRSVRERRAERKAKSLAAKTARDQRAEANITLEIKTK